MSRTIHIVWHEDRIRGAIDRARATTMTNSPDQPCEIDWTDLACLLDIARTWIREQDTP